MCLKKEFRLIETSRDCVKADVQRFIDAVQFKINQYEAVPVEFKDYLNRFPNIMGFMEEHFNKVVANIKKQHPGCLRERSKSEMDQFFGQMNERKSAALRRQIALLEFFGYAIIDNSVIGGVNNREDPKHTNVESSHVCKDCKATIRKASFNHSSKKIIFEFNP